MHVTTAKKHERFKTVMRFGEGGAKCVSQTTIQGVQSWKLCLCLLL